MACGFIALFFHSFPCCGAHVTGISYSPYIYTLELALGDMATLFYSIHTDRYLVTEPVLKKFLNSPKQKLKVFFTVHTILISIRICMVVNRRNFLIEKRFRPSPGQLTGFPDMICDLIDFIGSRLRIQENLIAEPTHTNLTVN